MFTVRKFLAAGLAVALSGLLIAAPTLFAEQPGADYARLTDSDVERVVTTLTTLINAAEASNAARLSADIVQRGWAADVLWNVESAVAAIDNTDRSQSATLQSLIIANGYDAGPNELLHLWGHYAGRVLRAHDAERLVSQGRDLRAEWLELERHIQADGVDAHADTIAELDYFDSLALYSGQDREPVLAWAEELQALRARVASWP